MRNLGIKYGGFKVTASNIDGIIDVKIETPTERWYPSITFNYDAMTGKYNYEISTAALSGYSPSEFYDIAELYYMETAKFVLELSKLDLNDLPVFES